jgi:hypothetical protein
MTTSTVDPRIDRLYNLLPAIYRIRDAEQNYPLQALLRVISEQVNVVEDDILQLYENWFIETAEDWVVPYIADLIGYRPVSEAGPVSDDTTREGRALNRILIPRREVANTIRYRRRKGTLLLLEDLAYDVAGWPARAVEFFKLLGWNQNLDHLHMYRARTADLRRISQLEQLNGPFDEMAHSVDIRRIDSHRTVGRYNIPSVGVFVWRLQSYSATHCPAFCAESAGPNCMNFSVLGQDAPLFISPEEGAEPGEVTTELNTPVPIRPCALEEHKENYYGVDKSFAIWAEGWNGLDPDTPAPIDWIIPADLTDWQYVPALKTIAVDPRTGRFAFPPSQLPKQGVRVTYHYGFPADLGGGEYHRPILDPSPRIVESAPVNASFYRVGKTQTFQRISDALDQWKKDAPTDAVIELTDSTVYVEPINIALDAGKSLQIRAANRTRPVIRLLDWQTDLPNSLSVTMAHGCRFVIDGLLITGRAMQITGPGSEPPEDTNLPVCAAEIVIRHCTLVPGWGIDCDCEPKRPAEPTLELYNIRAKVRIQHSILGTIQVNENAVTEDPIPMHISDSILDAVNLNGDAIGAPGDAAAHAVLTIRRCTVFGIIDVDAIELAENSIFNGCVNVARRQLGCMRFCYVPAGCRTPRRYHCQPDMVTQTIMQQVQDATKQKAAVAAARQRVKPQYNSIRYGTPTYAQLAFTCAEEIVRGADDESEMGVYHDLFQPQRYANLQARLQDFTPAGMDVGIILGN